MTVRISLVTPALTEGARTGLVGCDEPLDEPGREATWAVRESHSVASSGPCRTAPSLQCHQTAELLGLTAVDEPALRDWDLGAWRGRTMAEVGAQQPGDVEQWRQDPRASPHGGESLCDLLGRVGSWLGSLEGVAPRSMVAVTHASVVRACVVHALGGTPEVFWHLDVETLSVVRLTLRGQRMSVRWRSLTG